MQIPSFDPPAPDGQITPSGMPGFAPPASMDEVTLTPPAPLSDSADPMGKHPSHTMRIILAVLGTVLALVGVVVFASFQSDGVSGKQNCPTDTLCVSATKILQDYTTDIDAAQAVYQGRTVEITGIIEDAFLDDAGDYYTAIMDGGTASSPIHPSVGCRDLPYDDVQTWQTLHPNSWYVTLTGQVVAGQIGSRGVVVVALVGCRLKLS